MRLLIVKLSSIGDIVHTLPALAKIRRSFPDAEISWVAEKRSAEILRKNPLLTRLIEINTRRLRHKNVFGRTIKMAQKQFRNLRATDFDIAIDFQGLLKSAAIARLSGAKMRSGFATGHLREPAARHLYTHRFGVGTGNNIINQNIELAEQAIGLYLDDSEFRLEESELEFPIATLPAHRDEADGIRSRLKSDYVILNPAGGWVTKLWPAENYGKLADSLWTGFGLKSLITTGPGEKQLADRAVGASLSGQTTAVTPSLKAFVELSRTAKAYVGGDTAPTHLAVAANCPVIGIFGPTEWWRNGSPKDDDICVERNDIDCRENCHRRTCGKWICMDISVETVFLAIKARLGL